MSITYTTVSNNSLSAHTTFNNSLSTVSVNPVLTLGTDPATLKVDGNIVVNGVDLEQRLKIIEDVLMIPERDAALESKYPKLKKMYDDYIKELSKARMWETLKGESK